MRGERWYGQPAAAGGGVADGYRILGVPGRPRHGRPQPGRPPRLRAAHRRRSGRGDRRARPEPCAPLAGPGRPRSVRARSHRTVPVDPVGRGSGLRRAALRAVRDLSSIGTVVDVGGGQGRLLAGLLEATPGLSGVLFDRPEVVAGAEAVLRAAGVADRCAVVGGDFFASVPPGGDAYVLAQIVHDWPDAEALAILSACHRAMAPGARLWVIEQVLPPEDGPNPSERAGLTLLDLNMLVLFGGGQQRTGEEYRQLLGAAGFDEVAVVPAEGTPWSVVEAVRR